MKCPKCQSEYQAGDKFCRECGTKLNLSIKVSINTGMVYVGAIGPDFHSEFTVMGTAVTLFQSVCLKPSPLMSLKIVMNQ